MLYSALYYHLINASAIALITLYITDTLKYGILFPDERNQCLKISLLIPYNLQRESFIKLKKCKKQTKQCYNLMIPLIKKLRSTFKYTKIQDMYIIHLKKHVNDILSGNDLSQPQLRTIKHSHQSGLLQQLQSINELIDKH
jgi:non-homologous end joining protein Ku